MISGKAKVACVLGWPVGHSRSPALHGTWLARHGIDGAYVPLAIRPEHFAAAFRALPMLGIVGGNVTIPHKEAALAACDRVGDSARRIGAVNTFVVAPDGTIEGRNTDGFGFLENLRTTQPDWQPGTGPAMVLGAGGAARAVIVALLEAGVPRVRLANRSAERARRLAGDLDAVGVGPIEVHAWDARGGALADCTLLVNATSLGMTGQPALDIDLAALPPAAVVADLVYVPLHTDLLVAARARGHRCVEGLGMLIHQARPGFEAWFGIRPEASADLADLILGNKNGGSTR